MVSWLYNERMKSEKEYSSLYPASGVYGMIHLDSTRPHQVMPAMNYETGKLDPDVTVDIITPSDTDKRISRTILQVIREKDTDIQENSFFRLQFFPNVHHSYRQSLMDYGRYLEPEDCEKLVASQEYIKPVCVLGSDEFWFGDAYESALTIGEDKSLRLGDKFRKPKVGPIKPDYRGTYENGQYRFEYVAYAHMNERTDMMLLIKNGVIVDMDNLPALDQNIRSQLASQDWDESFATQVIRPFVFAEII